ncbi:type I toxin-antitoxin system Ibs family toxin [Escherichia coli]|nr:type I toxin-antitoxin system Ibs family toxin [Escherichia coli]
MMRLAIILIVLSLISFPAY